MALARETKSGSSSGAVAARAKERSSGQWSVIRGLSRNTGRRTWCSKIFGLGVGVTFHLGRPLQKTPQTGALAPQKFPKLNETDLRHLDAAVSLDPPQEIRTPPRSQTMAFGGVPHEAERIAHASMIPIRTGPRLWAKDVPSAETEIGPC